MANEFTKQQAQLLREDAERAYFNDFYNDVEDDVAGDAEYSWQVYTQTNDCDDWDEQDGTWGPVCDSDCDDWYEQDYTLGPVGYFDCGDNVSDTYIDTNDYAYQQALYL